MALPPFHVFGIVTELHVPIAHLVTTVVYPPRMYNDPLAQPVIPTSDNMIQHLESIKCNVLMTVPTFLEQMVESDEAIEVLKKLESVVCIIEYHPYDLMLIISRPLVVALYLSKSGISCGLLGYSSPAVMAGQSSEFP